MNCLICHHAIADHQKRGCYHLVPDTMSGLCLCTSTPEKIELAVVTVENARMRAALEKYAEPKNWTTQKNYTSPDVWLLTGDGYTVAQDALKRQAE